MKPTAPLVATFAAAFLATLVFAEPAFGQTVVINKLDDLNLGTWSGNGNITRTSRHCVASTAPGDLFNITITGDGPGGVFELAGGASSLPYRVFYRDWPGNPWAQVAPGVTVFNLRGRNNPNNCAGQRQRLRVRFMGADLAAVMAGSYSGTLTLVVSPM